MPVSLWIRFTLVFVSLLVLFKLQVVLIDSVVEGRSWLLAFGFHMILLMYVLRELAGTRGEGFNYLAFAVTFAVIALAPHDPRGTWHGVLLFNAVLLAASTHIVCGWVVPRR